MLVEGKVAIVTGGASGIGRAAAILFAREGALVTVADRDVEGGAAVVDEIAAAGGRAIFVATDVTDEAAVKAMVAATVAEYGGLDVAFNNAGGPGRYANLLDATIDDWAAVVDLNMNSTRHCMYYQIPEMLKRGGGAIVNTASRVGDSATYNLFGYTGTKHGVVGMTKSAALDFGPQNIRVNALMPGFTATPLLTNVGAKGTGMIGQGNIEARIPMKRLARPEEQAEVAVWLCSDRASYVTGITMMVDGGCAAVL